MPNREIVQYAVLVALTPLVPVPFLDDILKNYLQRRMVRKLGENYQYNFSDAEIRVLADEESRGCLKGCISMMIVYPLKKIFRKIFFFLEWKRAIDVASYTLHYGILIDYAMSEGWCAPTSLKSAAEVRKAVDALLHEVNTRPLEALLQAAFNQSKGLIVDTANILKEQLQRLSGKKDEESITSALQKIEPEGHTRLSAITDSILNSFKTLPSDYFTNLKERLRARLN